jgi:DNA-binding transcriptional regulator YiaG
MHPSLRRRFSNFLRSSARRDLRGSDKDVSYSSQGSAVASELEEERFKGSDVKKIRKTYNLSQRCFADMLDISIKTLQNYEIDRRTIPGTARSLFIFAGENIDLFKKYYLQKVDNLKVYMDSMNK